MSDYIQIPNDITTKLTKVSKHKEADLYANIRNTINSNRDTTNAKEKMKLKYAEWLNVHEKTIENYIKELYRVGLISGIHKTWGIDHRVNIYEFPKLDHDYFIVYPPFLEDINLSIEEKGVMLFIKANCEKGTNHFSFNSIADLKEKVGVGKNSKVINNLNSKGYVRFIDKTIIITNNNFPLYLKKTVDNTIYHIIYNYCLNKDIVPPLKEEMALTYLNEKYSEKYDDLMKDLVNKCKNLPKDVSLSYFCQALLNRIPENRYQPNEHNFIM